MPPFSFKARNRLRTPKIFDIVFKQGARVPGRYFIIFLFPNNQAVARLGIVISKRKCRLAVHRNHLRRIIREQFRTAQQNLAGYDLVVLLKTTVLDPQDPHIPDSLLKQFNKVAEKLSAGC